MATWIPFINEKRLTKKGELSKQFAFARLIKFNYLLTAFLN